MPKINFKYNEDRDIWNYWDSANKKSLFFDFSKFIPLDLLNKIKGKSYKESCDAIRDFTKLFSSSFICIFSDSVSESWSLIEEEYFKRLEKITKKQLHAESFTAYITTTNRCPYNKDELWFMISFFYSLPKALLTIGHEIFHFHFYENYFKYVEEKIGFEKAEDLKEALTVILNLEFIDLWHAKDDGYPKHKVLREFIEKEWKNNPDFDMLLNKCINLLM